MGDDTQLPREPPLRPPGSVPWRSGRAQRRAAQPGASNGTARVAAGGSGGSEDDGSGGSDRFRKLEALKKSCEALEFVVRYRFTNDAIICYPLRPAAAGCWDEGAAPASPSRRPALAELTHEQSEKLIQHLLRVVRPGNSEHEHRLQNSRLVTHCASARKVLIPVSFGSEDGRVVNLGYTNCGMDEGVARGGGGGADGGGGGAGAVPGADGFAAAAAGDAAPAAGMPLTYTSEIVFDYEPPERFVAAAPRRAPCGPHAAYRRMSNDFCGGPVGGMLRSHSSALPDVPLESPPAAAPPPPPPPPAAAKPGPPAGSSVLPPRELAPAPPPPPSPAAAAAAAKRPASAASPAGAESLGPAPPRVDCGFYAVRGRRRRMEDRSVIIVDLPRAVADAHAADGGAGGDGAGGTRVPSADFSVPGNVSSLRAARETCSGAGGGGGGHPVPAGDGAGVASEGAGGGRADLAVGGGCTAFLGVYDGHGGSDAVDFISKRLHVHFCESEGFARQDYAAAFREAFALCEAGLQTRQRRAEQSARQLPREVCTTPDPGEAAVASWGRLAQNARGGGCVALESGEQPPAGASLPLQNLSLSPPVFPPPLGPTVAVSSRTVAPTACMLPVWAERSTRLDRRLAAIDRAVRQMKEDAAAAGAERRCNAAAGDAAGGASVCGDVRACADRTIGSEPVESICSAVACASGRQVSFGADMSESYLGSASASSLASHEAGSPLAGASASGDAGSEELTSGATALAVFITGSALYVANLGDSRCILARSGAVACLTTDHRLRSNIDEAIRVRRLSGAFSYDGYLCGHLGVSRAFGNLSKSTGEKLLGLSSLPDVIRITLRSDDDEFFILACDGLFDVVTATDAVCCVRQSLQRDGNPRAAAQRLVDLALRNHSEDNVSVVVVRLFWPGRAPEPQRRLTSVASAPALQSLGREGAQASETRRRTLAALPEDLTDSSDQR